VNAKSYIYSIRTDKKGEPYLDIAPKGLVLLEDNPQILEINTSKGHYVLNKFEWMNKFKVFDDGSVFFILCNKQINGDYAFDFLLEYALNKIPTRISYLESLQKQYKNILSQRKQKRALAA
jgi:hypothetical protein